MISNLERHKLLNELIVVYKKNFRREENNNTPEQEYLSSIISDISTKINLNPLFSNMIDGGLTSIIVKSKH